MFEIVPGILFSEAGQSDFNEDKGAWILRC